MRNPGDLFQKLIDEFVTECEIPASLVESFPEIRDLQYYHPGLKRFWNKDRGDISLNHTFYTEGRLISWKPSEDDPNRGKGVIRYQGGREETKDVYVKTIHLLDPFAYLSGEYNEPPLELPGVAVSHNSRKKKLLDPNNQAYIDVIGMSILSRLNEINITPHAVKVYGAVCGVKKSYMYDITDEYETLKSRDWFWKIVGAGGENLHVKSKTGDNIEDEIIKNIKERSATYSSSGGPMYEDLDGCDGGEGSTSDVSDGSLLEELAPINLECSELSDISFIARRSGDNMTETGKSSATDDSLPYTIEVECRDMPVILLFEEAADGTMDDILMDDDSIESSLLSDDGSSAEDALVIMEIEKEEKWSAWFMQVVCALTQMQSLLGMCHNDLHINNVVWTDTDVEFIMYKSISGDIWKVPTYGKMFKIIDFGRATFRIGKREFMSDDFLDGNEAAGQYNYGPCYNEDEDIIPSNPSFDLCRLSVSLIDSLYASTPALRGKKKNRKIMMNEDGWIKYYTKSDLYNCLWKWMLDDNGHNILRDIDGEDKFPGFDLYIYIASYVHNSVPKHQLEMKPFSVFKLDGGDSDDSGADGKTIAVNLYIE